MNENLARQLLKADAMQWTDLEWTNERKFLDKFSNYKYDEYQQYSPGKRFIENLYLWLKQFGTIKERQIAYEYIKKNLVFISTSELEHLIKMTYPDFIIKYLLEKLKKFNSEIDVKRIVHTVKSEKFQNLKKQCLFLGLSDGARIDVLRRYAGLDHEQVYSTYLIADIKTDEFLDELAKGLEGKTDVSQKFKIAFLIDDFSASGLSFIRKDGSKFKGKIPKFFKPILNKTYVSKLFEEQLIICVILYIATTKAKEQIKKLGKEYFSGTNVDFDVIVIQEISEGIIDKSKNELFYKILQNYYDPEIENNKSFQVGNTNLPYLGFDGCGLSIVLNHNCPNNSLPLLWYHPDFYKVRGLFPRVERFPTITE